MSKSNEPVFYFEQYVINAMIQCIEDQSGVPHLLCDAKAVVGPPLSAFKEGRIVLNVAMSATEFRNVQGKTMTFKARFNGVSLPVEVDLAGVLAVYDRETGQGRSFASTYTPTPPKVVRDTMPKAADVTPASVLPPLPTEKSADSTVVNAADRFRNKPKE